MRNIRKKKKLNPRKEQRTLGEKLLIIFIVFIFITSAFAIFFAVKSLFLRKDQNTNMINSNSMMGQRLSKMSFTSFDVQLAKRLMDKDNDGRCDSCGMPVEMCIDGGELQCSMDSRSSIGKLGSQHIHADWKFYVNGKDMGYRLENLAMDMSNMNSPLTSSFIHMDKGAPTPEKTGDLIHMHANGVPLWIFFESIGMKFSKDCLMLNSEEKYCSDDKNILKFYVNGEPNNQYEGYVFDDLDKMLISYGDKSEDLTSQISSITDFARNH